MKKSNLLMANALRNNVFKIGVVLAVLLSASASADLTALPDEQLDQVSGAGLGFALEDFILNSDDSSLIVTGINSSNGNEIKADWTRLYIMGEGSNKGRNNTKANIGSYLNPWVIQTVRGSAGLTVGDAGYNPSYDTIRADRALIEFATDSYTNPLQNSALYGQFSFYQGCIYDEVGCGAVGANGTAVQKLNTEITLLEVNKNAIIQKYEINNNLNLSQLEANTRNIYTNFIAPEEVKVEAANTVFQAASVVFNQEAQDLTPLYNTVIQFNGQQDLLFGEEASSGVANPCTYNASCRAARNAYNNALPDFVDARDNKAAALDAFTATKVALNEQLNRTDFTDAQVSYLDRVNDIQRYKLLCGTNDDFTSCSDGTIVRKENTKDNVQSVSVALGNGGIRRKGLDIGVAFDFLFNEGTPQERSDYLAVDLKGVFVDGSYLRLWSTKDENNLSEINGELRLNLFVKEIDINVCNTATCLGNEAIQQSATLNLDNFVLSLNLGYGETQPMKFKATDDGNFEFELVNPINPVVADRNSDAKMQEFYDDYYSNAPKSFLYIGDVRLGNESIGSTTINGFRAQYLKVTSRDL
ncbi:MAG: hypothetical protein P1U57_11320 [Oleibacter sp.]|nr:hypothetical protein [Thalassolituus sp.]